MTADRSELDRQNWRAHTLLLHSGDGVLVAASEFCDWCGFADVCENYRRQWPAEVCMKLGRKANRAES